MAIRLFTCPLHGRWFILVFIEMKIDCVSHIYGRSVILKYTLGAGDEHKLELPMLCFQCSINNLDAFWKMTQHFVAVVCVYVCVMLLFTWVHTTKQLPMSISIMEMSKVYWIARKLRPINWVYYSNFSGNERIAQYTCTPFHTPPLNRARIWNALVCLLCPTLPPLRLLWWMNILHATEIFWQT